MISTLLKRIPWLGEAIGAAPWIIAGAATLGAVVMFALWKSAEAGRESDKVGYAKAEKAAVEKALERQKAQNDIDKTAAVSEAKAQTRIVEVTHTIREKVPVYVPTTTRCPVTAGFVRVLDAAVLGVSPADIPLAAGQSDDSCAAVDPRTLALNIVANYGACQANAQQLTSLQGWVTATIRASKGAK